MVISSPKRLRISSPIVVLKKREIRTGLISLLVVKACRNSLCCSAVVLPKYCLRLASILPVLAKFSRELISRVRLKGAKIKVILSAERTGKLVSIVPKQPRAIKRPILANCNKFFGSFSFCDPNPSVL